MVAVELSKIVVIVINLIFMIFGVAVLAVGIIFKVGWDKVKDAFVDNSDKIDFNLESAGDALATGAIVFGSFIVVVSLLGCIGACCRVRVMLVVYAIIVLLILIGEIVIVALAASNGKDAKGNLEDALMDSITGYREDSGDSKSEAFSAVFSTVECCAVTNYTQDFKEKPFTKAKQRPADLMSYDFPITCCHGFNYDNEVTSDDFVKHTDCIKHPSPSNAYTKGCASKIEDFIENYTAVCIGVGVAIFLIEIICIILSFYLCCSVEKTDYTV